MMAGVVTFRVFLGIRGVHMIFAKQGKTTTLLVKQGLSFGKMSTKLLK
jgi:hypothetical protein